MRAWLLLALVLSQGCVGKKKYVALADEYLKTRTQLEEEVDELNNDVARLTSKLEKERGRADFCETEKAELMQDQAKLQTSVQDMQKALIDLSKRKTESDTRINEFKSLLARFKSLIDAGKLRVKIVDGRMVVELATDILFGSGSAQLSPDGKLAIAEVAAVLASIPDRRFQVEGHTDNVPIKTAQYPSNWELAAARSVTVVKSLVDAGLPATVVSAASFAEYKPVYNNDTVEGKAGNRRIEIVVVPDLSQLPGFEELNKLQTVK